MGSDPPPPSPLRPTCLGGGGGAAACTIFLRFGARGFGCFFSEAITAGGGGGVMASDLGARRFITIAYLRGGERHGGGTLPRSLSFVPCLG